MSLADHNLLLGQSFQELSTLIADLGEPGYRARQLFHWLYAKRRAEVSEFSTLPAHLRSKLSERGIGVGLPTISQRFVSSDGTVRYLFSLGDGQSVEAVWMPEGDNGEDGDGSEAAGAGGGPGNTRAKSSGRSTICVSSQVGCAVNCHFCLTALLGLQRNLTAGEIVGQVNVILNDHRVDLERERMNLVFMGQGEPLLNFNNFVKAVCLLKEGVGIPESRMTVSTSGILPRIYDLGREAVRPKLAISLNAPDDRIRDRIMPINRKWKLADLIAAARAFPLRGREKITFEYVLLKDLNDQLEHAAMVAKLLRGITCKINLIAWNPGPEVPYQMPEPSSVLAFQEELIRRGLPAFIRKPRGRDIYAACGQLKHRLPESRARDSG